MHKQQRWPQAWEYCQAKLIQTLGRASQGVDWSWIQCIKKEKEKKNWIVAQWSKVLFSDKSTFCISFGNQGLEEDWRDTESKLLKVQCEVSKVRDDLGCRDVCWCWSIVFYQVQRQCSHLRGGFGALYASICWQALWRCWFPFPAGQCQTTFKWFADQDITVLDWPANMPDLSPICNLWGIFKRKMRKTSWRLNGASAVPQADRFHATPHWSWSLCQRSPDQVLSA